MTAQQIQALIDAKIKGQGSAIDIGGALPAILGGLTEQAFKAVSPDSTDMSEADQMQVRKNLDLYYETEQQTNTVNGTDEGEIYGDTWKHISDDTPATAKEIVSVKRGNEEVAFTVDDMYMPEGYTKIKNEDGDESWFLVILYPNFHYQGLPAGIYVATTPATVLELSLEYVTAEGETVKIPEKFLPDTPSSDPEAVKYVEQELTEAQQMQARKNQGLYYEEITEGEKTVQYDGETATIGYYAKISDDTPAKEDIISVNSDTDFILSDEGDGYLISVEGGVYTYFYVILRGNDAGIYFNTLYESTSVELVYKDETTTVHKIPAKYIPDMPSGGIETVELLSIPTDYANSAAESTFFSADDLAKVKSSGVCIAAYSASPARKFLVVNDAGTLTFYGKNGIEFMLAPYPYAGYFTVSPINGGSIILSGLPTASMTSAELEALGFGTYGGNFNAWVTTRAKNVVINDMFDSQVFGVVALTTTYLEFWDATNKYVVTNQNMQLACTVTPR